MSNYDLGCTVLGAGIGAAGGASGGLPSTPFVPTVMSPEEFANEFNKVSAPYNQAKQDLVKQQAERAKKLRNAMLIGGVVGSIIGGGGGAAMWAAHRFWGFFFGTFLVAPIGAAVGAVVADKD